MGERNLALERGRMRRSGAKALLILLALMTLFAAVVIWLVTGPVRTLKNRPAPSTEAPAAPMPGR